MILFLVLTAGFSFACFEFYQLYNDKPSCIETLVCYLLDDEFPSQKTSTPYSKIETPQGSMYVPEQLTKRVMCPTEEKLYQLV
jgi:hypothetical protein